MSWCHAVIAFGLIALGDGLRDVWTFNRRPPDKKQKPDIHTIFFVHRVLIAVPLALIDIERFWPCMVIMALIFPFLHDGIYYTGSNWITGGRVYPRRWFDHSKTSTARSTRFLTPLVRTLMFVMAILLGLLLFSAK